MTVETKVPELAIEAKRPEAVVDAKKAEITVTTNTVQSQAAAVQVASPSGGKAPPPLPPNRGNTIKKGVTSPLGKQSVTTLPIMATPVLIAEPVIVQSPTLNLNESMNGMNEASRSGA